MAPSYPQLTFEAHPKHVSKGLLQQRLDAFLGGRYSDSNLSAVLFRDRIDGPDEIKLEVWSAPGLTKPSFEEAIKNKFKPAQKGDRFGPSFEFDPSCEGLIYTTEGLPLHAIVGGFDSLRRVEFVLDKKARSSTFQFYVETSCNAMFGNQFSDEIGVPDNNRYFTLESADLVAPNQEAWGLMWDFELLKQMCHEGDGPLAQKSLYAANEICNTFKVSDSEKTIADCRKIAETIIGEGWREQGEMVYKGKEDIAQLWGLGHCHIDSAWMWPFSVTQQKVARSWSTQVDLMNRYPEHRFSATSAQQYKWLETLYPQLFEKVSAKIAEDQFGYIGGTWVEMDTNLPSAESLCRQFLYGQRFFTSRFGAPCDTFVLPDTFGYSGQLPQIARLAGAKNFFTQKLSWNSMNTFPHTTFNWCGIDGSQLLTHMTPVNTYNAQANFDEVLRGVRDNKNLEVTDESLYLFGNGDGGGGPTPPMLEKLRRIRSVANNNREVPIMKMGYQMDDFFDDLRKKTNTGTKLPNWRGELYFELHRGTYTSHASIKKGNRKCEFLLKDVEYLSTLASLYGDKSYTYPKEKLDKAWESLLLCQFHDVLPGSSIAMVYDDAEKYYAAIQKAGAEMIEDALSVLLHESIPLDGSISIASLGPRPKILAVNTMRVPRREVVRVPLALGSSNVVQLSTDKRTGLALIDATSSSIGEARGLTADLMPVQALHLGGDNFQLSNASMEFKIKDGRIVSVYDVALQRELIPEGQTGGLVIYEDKPTSWDAWEIEYYHLETATHLKFDSVSIVENGPLRASLGATVLCGQSTINVTISLDAVASSLAKGSRSMIRFDAVLDWHERHKFLKFELPVNINSVDATYETQMGTISRPTHRNTSWDAARFEVCCHKFADLSEFGYGVAILNDCKYGFATEGQIMRLSLLRAATAPDPQQDQGEHSFSFAIYPHSGHFLQSDVPQVAYAFNNPLILRAIKGTSSVASSPVASLINSFVSIDGAPNVFSETIKRSEDDFAQSDSGSVVGAKKLILRLYEAYGGHAKATVNLSGLDVTKVSLVNILEQEIETLEFSTSSKGTSVELDFRGFEIKTLLVSATAPAEFKATKPSSDGIEQEWVKIEKKKL